MKNNVFIFVVLLPVVVCQARIITVDANGPADFNNIQAAIDDANDGDTVEIQPGRYTGPGNRDIDFKGLAITVRSTEPNDPNIVAATVIDCNGIGRGFYFHNEEDANSVLAGLTITSGYAQDGGAIYCNQSSPTVSNCLMTGNTADRNGGGIYCRSRSNPQLLDCTIVNNAADEGGGGVSCEYNSNPYIGKCVIARNSTRSSSSGFGAGVRLKDSDPFFKNCIIEHNRPACWAGGIYSSGYDTTGPRFENCIIRFNAGTETGAGYCGRGTFVNCLITGNSAGWYSGGLMCGNGTLFDNCTIAGNFGGEGPGLHCGSSVTITNCILWANLRSGAPSSPIYGSPQVTHSNVQFGWPGQGNMDIDPQFAFFDPLSTYNDFHLMRTSMCIDTGTDTPPGGLIPTDLDGTPRPLDGDTNGFASSDMGAYEHNPNAARIAVSRDTIRFSAPAGGPNPPTQTFLLRNAGGGTLSWQINFESPWLRLSTTEGSSEGEIVEIQISVDTTSLSSDQYSEPLIISAAGADNSPLPVSVLLAVGWCRHVPSEYPTIQAAIDASSEEGDAVILAPQVYTGDGNRDVRIEDKSIILAGSNPSDPCVVAATVIDCEGTETSNHFGLSIAVDIPLLTMQPEQVVLDGITITRGHVDRGSAIGCNGFGSVIISRCLLRGNSGTAISCLAQDVLISECTITDNASTSLSAGIFCSDGTRITRCNISRNHGKNVGGVLYLGSEDTAQLAPQIDNSIISGNSADSHAGGICVYRSHLTMTNVTIVGNKANTFGGGITCLRGAAPTLNNCIFYGNTAASGHHIALLDEGWGDFSPQATINYCSIQAGPNDLYTDPNTYLYSGPGNIDTDPRFADAGYWDPNGTPEDANDDFWVDGDYHLKSQAGRWDPNTSTWFVDSNTSPCIDRGDPMSPIGHEPFPNGGIINMGAYGGTAEASKSYFGKPPCEIIVAGDINGDCEVNFLDFRLMALHWLENNNP